MRSELSALKTGTSPRFLCSNPSAGGAQRFQIIEVTRASLSGWSSDPLGSALGTLLSLSATLSRSYHQ